MTSDFGSTGEQVAARFVESLGWMIVDRNWRCELGEVDLVAIDPTTPVPTTVVIEVKSRAGVGFGHPLEAITREKLARLRRLAVSWHKAHPDSPRALRLDAIGVVKRRGFAPIIDHRVSVA